MSALWGPPPTTSVVEISLVLVDSIMPRLSSNLSVPISSVQRNNFRLPDPTAFSDLDQLYTHVLSYPTTVNIKVWDPIIKEFGDAVVTSELIEDVLGMEKGGLKVVLRGLSSLTAFHGDEDEEYLTEKFVSNVGGPYRNLHRYRTSSIRNIHHNRRLSKATRESPQAGTIGYRSGLQCTR